MDFDFTFKDGVTVPLSMYVETYYDNLPQFDYRRKVIGANVVARDSIAFDTNHFPVSTENALITAELIHAVFAKLKETTSEEFVATPRIGIKYILEKLEKEAVE